MSFDEWNNSGGFSFSRKRYWIASATKFFHRTNLATRTARGANEGAQIHHRVLEITRAFCGNELCRSIPQFLPTGGRIDWRANIEKAAENASGIGFDQGQGLVESEYANGVGSVTANPRQRFQLIGSNRKFPARFFDDGFSATVKITRPRIISEALPCLQNVRFSRSGKRAESGEASQPPIIVRDDGCDLRLLKHDFGNEDGIGIASLAPGKIALVVTEPVGEGAAKG